MPLDVGIFDQIGGGWADWLRDALGVAGGSAPGESGPTTRPSGLNLPPPFEPTPGKEPTRGESPITPSGFVDLGGDTVDIGYIPPLPGPPIPGGGIERTLGGGPGSNVGGGTLRKELPPLSIASLLKGAIPIIGDILGGVAGGMASGGGFGPRTIKYGTPVMPGGFSSGGGFPASSLPSLNGGRGPSNPFTQIGNVRPTGMHYAKDGSGKLVRNRRMNPMNYSAAMRAARRLKAARKLLQKIERTMPTRTVHSRAPARRR